MVLCRPTRRRRFRCVELHENEPAREARAILEGLTSQGYSIVNNGGGTDFTLMSEELVGRLLDR